MDALRRGDAVPHFEVRTVDGELVRYARIWQHENLVLLVLPAAEAADDYAARLTALRDELRERGTARTVTRDPVAGIYPPALLIADRWGEIVHVVMGTAPDARPSPADVLEWVEYLSHRCPECEGEAK